MLGRPSVRVTYAHKRRRLQIASKKSNMSSPLEVLPPDIDDLTRTQMARRMLKRSRRVALAEQLGDKNVDHIREHLAKRIKRTQERVSNIGHTQAPSDELPRDCLTFQTPFSASQRVHESTIQRSLAPEQLSPVPVAKRVVSRTSSRNLKENGTISLTLASPFSSRPGSAAPSPKHKGERRSSRRIPRISFSRTLSGVFKEKTRCVSRKGSTMSLRNAKKESSTGLAKHQRCPSSPSTAYMRSQFDQEDWITPLKTFSRTFDHDQFPSPAGSFSSETSFYADQPQYCSTPALSRLRKPSDTRADSLFHPFSLRDCKGSTVACDVKMMDGTAHPRRQTIHLSGNSIFSSSDEFTIGSHNDGTALDRNGVVSRSEVPTRVVGQAPADRSDGPHPGSFVAEYDIPLHDLDHSPGSIVARKMGPEGVQKSSVGRKSLDLPGTSPAHGENLVIHKCRKLGVPKSSVDEPVDSPGTGRARTEKFATTRLFDVPKSSVGEQPLGLPSTSPARGDNLIIRMSANYNALTSPASLPDTPSSPASELALDFQSMGICGDPNTHSDGDMYCVAAHVPHQPRSHSLQEKSAKRRPVRNRANTIRASDFAKNSTLGVAPGLTVPPSYNVRRTRSGTVVGPESKLATQSATLPTRAAKPPTRLAAVPSGSESESDDEILLKGFWMEDIEYLGLAVPRHRKDAVEDELNLGGLWHSLEYGPPRRPGLRRR